MALDNAHPLFETTDTFQQLVDHLNDYGDIVDSDLRWLDSQIGDINLLTTENIDSVPTKNVVSAINEIDSDIYGAGGGNFAAETLSKQKTILGAINSLFDVFDPDSAGFHFDSESFHLVVSGQGQSLSLVSDSDINIIAAYDGSGGDVKISADNQVQFRHLKNERVHIEFGADGKNTLYSGGVLEVHSKDSAIFKSDVNSFTFEDVIDLKKMSDGVYSTVDNNLIQDITGNYTINLENLLTVSPTSGNGNPLTVQFNSTETKISGTSPSEVTFHSTGDLDVIGNTITNKTDTVKLESPTDGVYGGFTNENGFLTIRSTNTDSAFLNLITEGLGLRTTQVTGMLELPPRPESGSLSNEFDNIGSRKLHDILEALHARIPNVYDRNGTLLNPL